MSVVVFIVLTVAIFALLGLDAEVGRAAVSYENRRPVWRWRFSSRCSLRGAVLPPRGSSEY